MSGGAAGLRVGVVGAGTMGVGIVYVFAVAGFDVHVVEPSNAQAQRMLGELSQALADGVRRGRIDDPEPVLARVTHLSACQDLPSCLDLVVETVPERVELKLQVLGEIAAREPKLVGSNTSTIAISKLSAAVADPSTFLGTHFFNPVWSLPMVELIRGEQTSDEAVSRAQALVSLIGKQAIVVADVPGFATSRLDVAAALEAMRMLEDGVTSADDIDRVAELVYRHPVCPLRLSDIVGLDVRLDIARALEAVYGERFRPPAILERLVAEGHLGRKTGRGFHVWPE